MGQTEQELRGLTISIVIELQIHNKPNSHNKVPPSQTINFIWSLSDFPSCHTTVDFQLAVIDYCNYIDQITIICHIFSLILVTTMLLLHRHVNRKLLSHLQVCTNLCISIKSGLLSCLHSVHRLEEK